MSAGRDHDRAPANFNAFGEPPQHSLTEKLALQLALVLPGMPDERDSCIQRLTDNLQAQGLEKVHVVQQDGKPFLCLHYDPAMSALPQVRSLAEAAGAELSQRYRHELMRIDGMDCSTCATAIAGGTGGTGGAASGGRRIVDALASCLVRSLSELSDADTPGGTGGGGARVDPRQGRGRG